MQSVVRALAALLPPELAQFGVVRTEQIPFSAEARALCEGNACRNYGRTWACPPAVGSPEACRAACLRYAHMLVFSAVYPLEDSFDFEGMAAGMRDFKRVCDCVAAAARPRYPDFLLLSNESCFRCATCTWPGAPCRHPESLHPAIEGYGIWVSELAKRAGMRYINGANTVTYFGGLLF